MTRKRHEVGVVDVGQDGDVLFDFHGTDEEWLRFQLALMTHEQGPDGDESAT